MLSELNTIISESPKFAVAYSLRGFARQRKRQHDLALADFSAAIRLDPEDVYSRYLRGVIFYQKQDYAKALVDFDEVIRRAPESVASAGAYRDRASIRSTCER